MKLPGSRKVKVGVGVAVALLAYMLVTWALGRWLELSGWNLWILRGALWVLGFIAAGIVLWFAGRGGGGEEPGETGDDEIDALIAAARSRLASSGAGRTATLGKLPLVLVLGPGASAKTANLVHCGLDPDLLAGEVFQGDQIGPTRAANLWHTQHTVLVEAGGSLGKDPGRWARLVHHVTPNRWQATLTGRAQARRVVVVCFSCEELLKPGAAAAVPAAAAQLRGLLVQLAQAFGIQLPVYVLFTKADRVPHFAEYAHHLSRDEAQQGVGVTLRWPARSAPGLYADREFQRLNEAFQQLFSSLAASRLQLLSRESETERRAAVYEFPRELRKIAPLAVQFLVDLCRPGQLAVRPVLRGFYFTAVRALVMSDAAAPPSPQAAGGHFAATRVFDSRLHQASRRDAAAPAAARKVPQWLFLGGVFRDVILRDRAGDAMAQGGVHVALWRRGLLAAVAGVSLIWLLGMPVSCFNNRRLAARSLAAAQGLAGLFSSEADVPSPETLTQLERLRHDVELLADYDREGPPLRLRWGLYQGSALYQQIGRIYSDRLEALLLGPARASLARTLRSGLDASAQTGDYGRTYNLLKGYLMTTTHASKIEPGFLDSLLVSRWLDGRQVDSARLDLVRRQFEFYARKLCVAYRCGTEGDGTLVNRARDYLLTFAGPERIYQVIVADASARNPPVQFARRVPAAAAVLSEPYDVPGAFTAGGWASMQKAFANVDQFFKAEDWVLGGQGGGRAPVDRTKLVGDLRALYDAEFVRRWSNFLASAKLMPFGGPRDAAQKLQQLSDNQSPLLQLLAVIAQNTAVDTQALGAAFQPVRVVTPPSVTDKFVSESNKPYMDALVGLQTIAAQAASAPPGAADALLTQTMDRTGAARQAVAQLQQKFLPAGPALEIGQAVRRLLEEPVARFEQVLASVPAQGANQQAASFCTVYQPLRAKYPFNPSGGVDATLPEVTAIFHPQNGAVAGLKNALASVLVQQGTRFLPMPGGAVRPSPMFLDFFNRAAGVSGALWQAGPTEARFPFSLRPTLSDAVPVITVSMDGQVWEYTRTKAAAHPFDWVGSRAREVRVTAQIRGREEVLRQYGGTWAVFKLFNDATWRNTAPAQLPGMPYILQWPIAQQGVILEMELNLGQAPPFLRKDFFAGMGCVSRVQ